MLTFGQIRERFENYVGENVDAVFLGNLIDEAQIEVSKRFGVRTYMWYPRPIVYTTQEISETDVLIPVDNVNYLPVPPNELSLGLGELTETISYNNTTFDSLSEVTRGEGDTTARIWPLGTPVSRLPLAGIEHTLPDDCLEVHEIRDVDDMPVFGYQINQAMKMRLFNDGYHKLIYTKVPDPINYEDNGAVPEVHPVFHSDLIVYAIAKHWEMLAEGIAGEENKAMSLMAQFVRKVEESARMLKRNQNQQLTIGHQLWG